MQRPVNQSARVGSGVLGEGAADTIISVTMRDVEAGPAPSPEEELEVVLLPQGRVALQEGEAITVATGATWEALGHVRQGAEDMSFVRAEIRGATWSTLICSDWLDERNPSPPVTLRQQAQPHEPLSGWDAFC